MSRWNIAAAQYAPRHNCVDEHVKHHLHFIAEAAWHGCDLIVFPELSLTGPGGTSLPPPPDDLQLAPPLHPAPSRFITVITRFTPQQPGQRQA
ncbi:nitrilase-related carbon-nitrogen hydrolase [Enterobacter hormaechei]|uniref:nitrilase-related carbon-nitrogen hydrolase n=1 Tax=Enterobacter hormaechei TaxID=158836 RepID=UPI0021086CAA|nr:nitrilase-related carbon-nitrogen hydrolase [Enterobacter hormaechei]